MLSVPDLEPAASNLEAGLHYGAASWYVLPIRRGAKDPGSVVGKGWQHQSSRDPEQIAAWLAGSDDGLALHAGRSGAVILDVDHPDQLPDVVRDALATTEPPFQSTRADRPGRGHYVYGMPPGRLLGNGVGRLGGAWGEIRGANGVIVAAPSVHADAAAGGRYVWQRTGAVPLLPDSIAAMLDDASPSVDAASDDTIRAFLAEHTGSERPGLLEVWCRLFQRKVTEGDSRHARMTSVLAGAMKEARAGYFPAQTAAQRLRQLFLEAVGRPSTSGARQGEARTGGRALSEWAGLLAWAVAQAQAADVAATLRRTEARLPTVENQLAGLIATSTPPAALPGPDAEPALSERHRALRLTRASDIQVRPVHWLWEQRIALGTLALLGGREGLGKSTVAYWLTAVITRGQLPGMYAGQPRAVVVAASEDSWSHTVVPRLLAHGADLERVYRVDVTTLEGNVTGLSLPQDLIRLREVVLELGAALILLDPLMSRLDAALDTHKDAEVRQALEPLVQLADDTGASVLGLIHVNKGSSGDPLTALMGSRAFAAVARAVTFVMLDPDDETLRLFGQPKNNLGRTDLPTLTFRVQSATVAHTDEGPVTTGRVVWEGQQDRSIREAMEATRDTADVRGAASEAGDWLEDYLRSVGGTADSSKVKDEGKKAGHTIDALKRARQKKGIVSESAGFPRRSYWRLPPVGASSGSTPGETQPTALTAPTGQSRRPVGAVGAVGAVGETPREAAPTGDLAVESAAPERCTDCGWPDNTAAHETNCVLPLLARELGAEPVAAVIPERSIA